MGACETHTNSAVNECFPIEGRESGVLTRLMSPDNSRERDSGKTVSWCNGLNGGPYRYRVLTLAPVYVVLNGNLGQM